MDENNIYLDVSHTASGPKQTSFQQLIGIFIICVDRRLHRSMEIKIVCSQELFCFLSIFIFLQIYYLVQGSRKCFQ